MTVTRSSRSSCHLEEHIWGTLLICPLSCTDRIAGPSTVTANVAPSCSATEIFSDSDLLGPPRRVYAFVHMRVNNVHIKNVFGVLCFSRHLLLLLSYLSLVQFGCLLSLCKQRIKGLENWEQSGALSGFEAESLNGRVLCVICC